MKHLEYNLQIAAVTWFKHQYPHTVILHPKNGGSLKTAREGARFKAMGVLAGVADLFIVKAAWVDMGENYDTRIYHGFFIELKAGKNGQTEAQKLFAERVQEAGYKYEVVRSLDEFIETVKKYMS